VASSSQQQSEAPSVYGQQSISQQPTTFLSTPPIAEMPQKEKSRKTLLDWLQLLIQLLAALAIPIAIALGTLWFSYQQNQTNQQIAADQQREAALQSYLDHMTDLLLNYKLESNPSYTIREVATVRTLTVLPRLDPVRKGEVVKFLYHAGLIGLPGGDLPIIDLKDADLSGADLSGFISGNINFSHANLSHADLSRAGLCYADLAYADLDSADLRFAGFLGATLYKTNLKNANLDFANLGEATVTQAQLEQAKSHNSPNDQSITCGNGG
jgi:Pentapeptide repeats (8 copies)